MSNQFVAGIRNVQLLYIPSQLPVERQGKVFQSHTDSYGSNNLHFRMLQHNECMGLVCMYVCVYFPTSAGAPRVGQAQLTWVASHIPMVYPHTHTHTHTVLAIWKWEVIEKSITSCRVGDRWWSIIIGLLAMSVVSLLPHPSHPTKCLWGLAVDCAVGPRIFCCIVGNCKALSLLLLA